MIKKCLAVAACISVFGAAAETVEIFTLPLGGSLESPISNCTVKKSVKAKICWLSKPFNAGGGVSIGSAAIRDDLLPNWAATETPSVQIKNGKFLHSISYRSSESLYSKKDEIVQSITRRFGVPQTITHDRVSIFTWNKFPGRIEFGCNREVCFLEILSDVADKERVEQMERRAQEKKQRPNTL